MKNLLFFFLSTALGISLTAQVQTPNFDDIQLLLSTPSATAASGDKGGVTSDMTGMGGGQSNTKLGINVDWPANGLMLAINSELNWKNLDGMGFGPYQVQIWDKTEDKKFFAAVAQTSISIPLDDLDLKEGEEYTLQVTSSGGDMQFKSRDIKFTIANPTLYYESLKTAKNSEKFESVPTMEKMFMKALALQANGFHHEAYKLYSAPNQDEKQTMIQETMARAFMAASQISCLCK